MSDSQKYSREAGPFHLITTPLERFPDRRDDPVVIFASAMATVHNIWKRALNGIYICATRVPESEYLNFVGYAAAVIACLQQHHHEEEEFVFPEIEKAAGAKGIMAGNREQHETFEEGFNSGRDYLQSLLRNNDTASFSGRKLCQIIDSFHDALDFHFNDEIRSLLELDKYPHIDFPQMQKKMEKAAFAHFTFGQMLDALPCLMLNHDRTYEGGIHGPFPPLPLPMSLLIRKACTWWHAGWWKYATCDTAQHPKSLPYEEAR